MSSHSIALYTGYSSAEMDVQLAECSRRHRLVEVREKDSDYTAEGWIFRDGSTVAVWLRKLGEAPWEMYAALGKSLDCPWLHVLFQEKVAWEYALYRGEALLDQFVPAPEMWGRTEPSLGQPDVLAQIWGVKVTRISRYLRHWTPALSRKKAYWWRDRRCYGDFEQGYDFVHALTGLRMDCA